MEQTLRTESSPKKSRSGCLSWPALCGRRDFLYKRRHKKCFFFTFGQKKGRSRPIQKILIRKKLRWSKKGEGGSVFLLKVKKNIFYASPKPIFHNYFGIVGRIFSYVPNIVYFHIGGRDGGEGGLEQRRGVLHNIVANSEVANLSLFQVFCPSSNEWSKMAKPMTEVNGWCSACLGSFLLLWPEDLFSMTVVVVDIVEVS